MKTITLTKKGSEIYATSEEGEDYGEIYLNFFLKYIGLEVSAMAEGESRELVFELQSITTKKESKPEPTDSAQEQSLEKVSKFTGDIPFLVKLEALQTLTRKCLFRRNRSELNGLCSYTEGLLNDGLITKPQADFLYRLINKYSPADISQNSDYWYPKNAEGRIKRLTWLVGLQEELINEMFPKDAIPNQTFGDYQYTIQKEHLKDELQQFKKEASEKSSQFFANIEQSVGRVYGLGEDFEINPLQMPNMHIGPSPLGDLWRFYDPAANKSFLQHLKVAEEDAAQKDITSNDANEMQSSPVTSHLKANLVEFQGIFVDPGEIQSIRFFEDEVDEGTSCHLVINLKHGNDIFSVPVVCTTPFAAFDWRVTVKEQIAEMCGGENVAS